MQKDIDSFFRPVGSSLQVEEEDYEQVKICTLMADAMARSTNSSLYIIDYHRKNFLYVSSNPLFLCGYIPEEVQQKGYGFYFEVVPVDELQMLCEINEAGFKFYYNQPMEKRLDYIIEYDFHIRVSDGHMHLIHHKLAPMLLDRGGNMWLALCTVSLSPSKKIGNVLISDKNSSDRFQYSFEGNRWHKQPDIMLTERERDILQLSVKGFSNAEIAENLFVDVNTVKFHKKKLFQKLQAENITEAIGITSNLKLI